MTIGYTLNVVYGFEDDVIGVLDVECQKNYHDWCFGEKWIKLVEQNPQCERYEDGSVGCIGDKVFNYDTYMETGKKVYCTVVTLEGNDKCKKEDKQD